MPGFFVNPGVFASCRRTYPVNWRGLRCQLGQTTQILDGCSKSEFVARTTESAQSQPIKFQYPLEVRKQHLDLLAFVT